MTTAMRLNLVADSLNELKLPCHVHAVREAASEIEALQKELEETKSALAVKPITPAWEIAKLKEERDSLRAENEQLRETLASQREAFEIGLKWKRNSALEEWFPITAEEITSLRSRVVELEKDNAALHDRCFCAFCKQEFSKRDLAAVADHLTNCEQSPLVKRGKELFEMCNILEAKIAELEAEADKEHAKAVELCDKLIEARRRIEELEKDKERLLKAFRHTHRNNSQNDNCAFCGLDLRDEIHIRIAAMSAEKK